MTAGPARVRAVIIAITGMVGFLGSGRETIMREGRLVLRVGALAMGAALAVGLALPAAADHTNTAVAVSPDGSTEAVADSVQSFVGEIVEVDPQVAFTDAFLVCAVEFSISDCTEEVLEDLTLEDAEFTVVDNTPLNPVDEGSIEEVDDVNLGALPPV